MARFVDAAHRALGATRGSTFCIVLFGADTAFPHSVADPKPLERGDSVLVDTGCILHGYLSDLTRSYVFGTPTAHQRRVWEQAPAFLRDRARSMRARSCAAMRVPSAPGTALSARSPMRVSPGIEGGAFDEDAVGGALMRRSATLSDPRQENSSPRPLSHDAPA